MNNPALYAESNSISKHDASAYIKKYKNLLKWQESENILDIGCGDGAVTLETLLPEIPKNFSKLIALDVSPEMVDFAKKRCNNPKINFRQFNIGSNEIPGEFKEHFHHIFSFYCLHWLPDQRQTFRNIYNMLKPGGQIFVTLIAHCPRLDVFLDLQKIGKWEPYMEDFGTNLFPYQWITNGDSVLDSILAEEGFDVEFCKLEEKSYSYLPPDFDKFIVSLNPYVKKIAKEDQQTFVEDYLKIVKNHEKIDVSNINNGRVVYNYKVLIALASKR